MLLRGTLLIAGALARVGGFSFLMLLREGERLATSMAEFSYVQVWHSSLVHRRPLNGANQQ